MVVAVVAQRLIAKKKSGWANAPRYGERPTVVRTVVSRVGDLERSRTYLGVVEPLNQVTIAARVSTILGLTPLVFEMAVGLERMSSLE